MTITPGRLVALLTPLVFAPLAGAIAVTAAKHLPGVEIDPAALEEIFVAGAVIAFGKSGLWLKGWQDYERRQDTLPDAVADDVALEASPAGGLAMDADAADEDELELADGSPFEDDELDDLLGDDDELPAPVRGSA